MKLSEGKNVHSPFSLKNALKMHLAYAEHGDMRKTVYE